MPGALEPCSRRPFQFHMSSSRQSNRLRSKRRTHCIRFTLRTLRHLAGSSLASTKSRTSADCSLVYLDGYAYICVCIYIYVYMYICIWSRSRINLFQVPLCVVIIQARIGFDRPSPNLGETFRREGTGVRLCCSMGFYRVYRTSPSVEAGRQTFPSWYNQLVYGGLAS